MTETIAYTGRIEDERLATGRGRYVADLRLPRLAHAFTVRSVYAHAKIRKIDTATARRAPGVLCVLTGEDWIKSGWGDLPVPGTHKRRDGSTNFRPSFSRMYPAATFGSCSKKIKYSRSIASRTNAFLKASVSIG